MTSSMANEVYRRWTWRDAFEQEVDKYCPDPTYPAIVWSDALSYYHEGYSPRDAARMYCEAHHIGVNQ